MTMSRGIANIMITTISIQLPVGSNMKIGNVHTCNQSIVCKLVHTNYPHTGKEKRYNIDLLIHTYYSYKLHMSQF